MANNQKTTKKKTKKRLNFKGVLFLALVGLLIFGLGKLSLKINIKSVDVEGNNYLTSGQIIKLAGLNDKVSYFGMNKRSICKKIKSDDFIDTCEIKRELAFKVKIIVTENEPLFYYLNDNVLVLSNGKKISDDFSYPAPSLINYTPEEVLDKFIDGLSNLKSDIIKNIAEIEYSPSKNNRGSYYDENRFMLEMNDGNIVYVNNQNIEALDNYSKIYASIGDVKGYYNFDSERIKYDKTEGYKNYLYSPFEGENDELQ